MRASIGSYTARWLGRVERPQSAADRRTPGHWEADPMAHTEIWGRDSPAGDRRCCVAWPLRRRTTGHRESRTHRPVAANSAQDGFYADIPYMTAGLKAARRRKWEGEGRVRPGSGAPALPGMDSSPWRICDLPRRNDGENGRGRGWTPGLLRRKTATAVPMGVFRHSGCSTWPARDRRF